MAFCTAKYMYVPYLQGDFLDCDMFELGFEPWLC